MNKTAIIIGATGLVGKALLKQLLEDESFSGVKIFVRRPTGIQHQKLQETVIDFDKLYHIKEAIVGDVLFSCMGTTLKQAGSKSEQYKVDYTYQYEFAKLAHENGIASYVLVSSTSASAKSSLFYSRIKGELEEAGKKLGFAKTIIVQPSVLSGERSQKRAGEAIGAGVINTLSKLFPGLKKYRSIPGSMVAKAMVSYYKQANAGDVEVYKLDELFV